MFEDELRKALESTPALTRRGQKIIDVLDMRPSKKRTRIIDRMERHVAAHLGIAVKIDWSQIDWTLVIEIVLKILLAILPMLLL